MFNLQTVHTIHTNLPYLWTIIHIPSNCHLYRTENFFSQNFIKVLYIFFLAVNSLKNWFTCWHGHFWLWLTSKPLFFYPSSADEITLLEGNFVSPLYLWTKTWIWTPAGNFFSWKFFVKNLGRLPTGVEGGAGEGANTAPEEATCTPAAAGAEQNRRPTSDPACREAATERIIFPTRSTEAACVCFVSISIYFSHFLAISITVFSFEIIVNLNANSKKKKKLFF
jgi:hypothetical protein